VQGLIAFSISARAKDGLAHFRHQSCSWLSQENWDIFSCANFYTQVEMATMSKGAAILNQVKTAQGEYYFPVSLLYQSI